MTEQAETIKAREERNDLFSLADNAALDRNGNYISFGSPYTTEQGHNLFPLGLDLRSAQGWILVWDATEETYGAVKSSSIFPEA